MRNSIHFSPLKEKHEKKLQYLHTYWILKAHDFTFLAFHLASLLAAFTSSIHGAFGGVCGLPLSGGFIVGVPNCTLSLFWTNVGMLQ